ncbi:MAG TPA: UDP-N-acetylmuramate:L-alanyl-gamma-D-glutamyl-meso-diaminopimelate ligase [Oceanospirillales bacterium]|nr:UDP-N-acetylmuramate:L-alanyl-gamma-D-glutamyl-meso-diaminopimelate ligase [Oceanospirillales bacterium]
MNNKKIHILGICGTFMGGLAALARSLGYEVSGSDKNVYPPMSTQLQNLGITMHKGYDDSVLKKEQQNYEQVVVGNVMTRGMPVIESLLNSEQAYVSGPRWLGEKLLRHKKVFAVAGTHGKTTTSSMLAWILADNKQNPGFLIGGVAQDFGISARNTDSESFVIEADEYDSAFFDKRSKFVHYHANIAILNNLEFDHADIFKDLDAIKTQFHHFIRTIPNSGCLVVNHEDENLKQVLQMGCWTPIVRFGLSEQADIWANPEASDCSEFTIYKDNEKKATISWNLTGKHNMLNALAAMTAALQQGINLQDSAKSLAKFQGIKRRMEFIGEVNGIKIYDDFAHHPTAIATTIEGIKNKIGSEKLIVVFEPRSNSMRAGAHAKSLPFCFAQADTAIVMTYPELKWQDGVLQALHENNIQSINSIEQLLTQLEKIISTDTTVVFMSNGSFDNAPRQFLKNLQPKC